MRFSLRKESFPICFLAPSDVMKSSSVAVAELILEEEEEEVEGDDLRREEGANAVMELFEFMASAMSRLRGVVVNFMLDILSFYSIR